MVISPYILNNFVWPLRNMLFVTNGTQYLLNFTTLNWKLYSQISNELTTSLQIYSRAQAERGNKLGTFVERIINW